MKALLADRLPPKWPSIFGIVLHRRAGLADPANMPRIMRELPGARVDAGWLREYRSCTGLSGQDARHLPPLALQIAAAPLHLSLMADAAFPFRPLGIVHQAQRVEQHGGLDPSASYDLIARTSDAREEKRGISFGLVTEARQDGALVWSSDIRVLSITRGAGVAKRSGLEADEFSGLVRLNDEAVDVPEWMGRRYARIAGDFNPVHVNAMLARLFGFRRAIAHGTWTLARALAAARLPATQAYVLDAQFRRPVELPSRILLTEFAGPSAHARWLRVSDADGVQTLLRATISRA